jgi:SAM-dependent methyltransferase
MAAPAPAGKSIPLGLKLKAWWEGYDAEKLAERLQQREDAAKPPAKTGSLLKVGKMEPSLITPSMAYGEQFQAWDTDRVSVAQLIWGEGYCGPGGPEQVITMSKLLALSPEMSMMHIGAGVGGPARTLAEEFGVWVTGYEESQALVDRGNELSTMAGLAKKAEMMMLDMSLEHPFGRKFDRAMASNFFVYHEAKAECIAKIADVLKPDALFLITDLFLADNALVATDGYRDWRASEPRRPSPCERGDMTRILEEANFTVRVDDDLTAEYVAQVTQAWSRANAVVAEVMGDPARAHLSKVVLREAEVWSRRLTMFKSGRLTYRRMVATKREGKGNIR